MCAGAAEVSTPFSYYLVLHETSSFGHTVSRCVWLRCSTSRWVLSSSQRYSLVRHSSVVVYFEPCHCDFSIAVLVNMKV